jgi:hypothetical protein
LIVLDFLLCAMILAAWLRLCVNSAVLQGGAAADTK